jgi:hypothetical protein
MLKSEPLAFCDKRTGLPNGGPEGGGLTKKTKSEVCCASFPFFMPPNAQIRAFGILRHKKSR